jgi:uncharacterized protein with von Willebrand factor type A (vWA) domain
MRTLFDNIDDDYYGDYYTPTYTPKKSVGSWKSKYGGGSWSKNSWSTYSFIKEVDEDDDSNLFVKDPVNYITPTSTEIKKKLRYVKSQESIDMIKELARACYFKMIEEPNYLDDKYLDVDSLTDKDRAQYDRKKPLIDSIYGQYIPGFTPLEQAVAIYLKLASKNEDSDGERQEDDELDLKKGLDFDRKIYADPDINEQLELNDRSRDKKMEIMNHLSLVGKFGSEFKVEKEISEKIVANSDEYSKMIMRDYAQMHMMDLYQKMFPNFRTKFLTKDLTVNVPVDRKEQIQKIIIILDFSGSMWEDSKQTWVNAILIDRFRYVMKGEAEVFFSYFVHDPDQLEFQHIKNKEDVIKFWQTFSNEPNGGETAVAAMVERISDEISSGRLCNLDIDLSHEKPEILILNDGQDRINTDEFPYKVNAVSLIEFNDELRDLCLATGGKQIKVTCEDRVYSYTEGVGEQEIKI